jgi:Bacterial SH3 domain
MRCVRPGLAAMKKDVEATVVSLPEGGSERPPWARVGIFAVVGLVIGIAWPNLAGIRIGPRVPGAKKAEEAAAAANAAASATSTATAPNLAATAPAPIAPAAPAAKMLERQLVVVGDGNIDHCFERRDRLAGEKCGKLKVDHLLVNRLEKLDGCPSALGLAGEMGIGFDIDFKKQEIAVRRGDIGDMPSSTVNGIMACAADYIGDVAADKIPHKHDRYRVSYKLSFHPPGTAVPRSGSDAVGEDDADSERGLASISWDTGLVRDEPRTGKVIARLVRGTRVKILGRRKDWYRVKIGSKEGWLYRAALGL